MRYSSNICGRFQRGAEIMGKRWTGLILQILLTQEPLRFNEIADRLEVVSDRVLSERLKELEQEGILIREVYPETPIRVEYRLTDKGRGLGAVIEALAEWAETWIELSPELAAEVEP